MALNSIKNNSSIKVYGDGKNIRDWIFVDDHCRAVDLIYNNGKKGTIYNVAGKNEVTNLELINLLYSIFGKKCTKSINFVRDRYGHDKRYSVDISKINAELLWEPEFDLPQD